MNQFVTHDNCQQVVREVFYGNTYFGYRSIGLIGMIPRVLFQFAFTPLFALGHTLSKMGCIGIDQMPAKERSYASLICRSLDAPVNRLVSQASAYLIFVVCIILTLANPADTPNKLDFDPYDVMSFVYALGFLVADCEQMYNLARSAKKCNYPPFKRFSIRVGRFFSTASLNYRFVSHLAFLLGCIFEFVGYQFYAHLRKKNTQNSSQSLIDDATSYTDFHMVKIGTCLQGIAMVMIITQLLQYLKLHSIVGAVYVAMNKCLWITSSFMTTYFTLTLAFTLGIHFVLKSSTDKCHFAGAPGATKDGGVNSTFYQEPDSPN
jgi:hypothetical protein